MTAKARQRREDRAETRAEVESHLASRSDVWTAAELAETECWRKNAAAASAKNRSWGIERREGKNSETRRDTARSRKRKRTAADWKEVRRWTGVWPLMTGSDVAEETAWWAAAMRRKTMSR